VVPLNWYPRRDIAAPGVFLGPSAGNPESHPEMLLVRESDIDVSDPEAILTNLRSNAEAGEWTLVEGEVRDFGGGKTQLLRRERVRLDDILHMALMCSDNVAARILARESGLAHEEFLARMNTKAIEIGLTHSRFTEVTGLDPRNVSTASDVGRMVHAACNQPPIRRICQTRSHDFSTGRRAHYIPNTNRMLYSQYEVKGGKTGYISQAGYCFATWVRKDDRDLIAVVLNAPTAATRFADVHRLLKKSSATTTASN
jgi:D-alanyl-D-alanine endopeptidase (penicillin-binding protein 7)